MWSWCWSVALILLHFYIMSFYVTINDDALTSAATAEPLSYRSNYNESK